MEEQKLAAFAKQYVSPGISRLTDEILEYGAGSYVATAGGRHFLDFTCGVGVTNLGHCHPKVTKAVQEQAGKISHAQITIGFHRPYLKLIENLLPMMPHPSLDAFFFSNSGSEAIEVAIRVARRATGKPNIIVMQGGFHGRTYACASLTTSKTIFREGPGMTMSGVFVAPFPYCAHTPEAKCSGGMHDPETCWQGPLRQLELLLKQQSAPGDTAALLIEPVQGEGGYVPAPPEYLVKVRELCEKHEILMIVDEVQCGFGRTGKMFAVEHSGVRPDIMVMAKGLANGYPLSGIVTSKKVMDLMAPGTMGGTYSGNAICCAAAVAAAEVFREEKILENVDIRGRELRAMLDECATAPDTKDIVLDVRGLGLMLGMEFQPGHNYAVRIQEKCLEKGMFVLTTSIYDTLRFIPPLNITEDDMKKGINIIRTAIQEVAAEERNGVYQNGTK
jgi:4-aminobutyrate aminotransferase